MKKIIMISGVCLGQDVDALPREVHEVEDGLGASLVARGKARLFEPATDEDPVLEDMKAGQLLEYAELKGLGLDKMKPQDGKDKILAAVKAALVAKAQA